MFLQTGITFSNLLVNAGITTIEKILKTNPREIELVSCVFVLNKFKKHIYRWRMLGIKSRLSHFQ